VFESLILSSSLFSLLSWSNINRILVFSFCARACTSALLYDLMLFFLIPEKSMDTSLSKFYCCSLSLIITRCSIVLRLWSKSIEVGDMVPMISVLWFSSVNMSLSAMVSLDSR
jgi:hypothetical protein